MQNSPLSFIWEETKRNGQNESIEATESYMFERMFFLTVWKTCEEGGMSQKEFARRVFKESADPGRKMQSMLKIQPQTGLPQRLLLSDAYAMAELVGLDFPTLAYQIRSRLLSFLASGKSISQTRLEEIVVTLH